MVGRETHLPRTTCGASAFVLGISVTRFSPKYLSNSKYAVLSLKCDLCTCSSGCLYPPGLKSVRLPLISPTTSLAASFLLRV
jgi:hypothetical protein